jgi:microcystin-dependent protein
MTTPYIISTPPPAVGYVACFIGGGTTSGGTNPGDPNGWVICDGQQRTVTDGRYAALFPLLNTYLSVNTNTANTIKPPDFRTRFLKGQERGDKTTILFGGTTGGIKLVSNQVPDLSYENFTYTDPGHTHTISASSVGGGSTERPFQNNVQAGTLDDVTNERSLGITARYVNPNQTAIDSIMPPYFTINYIIKY